MGKTTLRTLAEEQLRSKNTATGHFVPDVESHRIINELQVHQIELAEKERDLVFDYSLDMLCVVGFDYYLKRVSPSFGKILGWSEAELLSTPLIDFIHPDDLEATRKVVKDHEGGKQAIHFENRYQCKDGSYKWLSWNAHPMVEEKLIVGVARDITKRKLAEEALRQSDEQFHTLFNVLNEGFCIIEVLFNEDDQPFDCRLLEINPAFEVQTGLQNTHGKLLSELALDHDAYWIEIFGKVALTGEPVRFVSEAKAALNLWYDVTAYRVGGQDSRKVAILFNDISVAKRAEAVLQNAHDELEKQVEVRTMELREKDHILLMQSRLAAMGEMIGNITHQWRQPLNTLGLTIQYLSVIDDPCELTTEFLADYVKSSMELIQHMSKTIDDFSNYFRPDKNKIEFKVSETIVNTLTLLEGSLQTPKISIEIVEKDKPVINGFQNEFVQVLINILNNARDALIEKEIHDPRVTITIWSEDGCAVVTIADNAGGIPEEILDKIFDPYFTTKGPQQGTGVGLFMSKSIIEKNMGGKLAVRNIDNGAEFRIEVCN